MILLAFFNSGFERTLYLILFLFFDNEINYKIFLTFWKDLFIRLLGRCSNYYVYVSQYGLSIINYITPLVKNAIYLEWSPILHKNSFFFIFNGYRVLTILTMKLISLLLKKGEKKRSLWTSLKKSYLRD